MVDLARFTRLDHEASLHAQALADQVMVDGGCGQSCRDGDAVRADSPVRKDQDVAIG